MTVSELAELACRWEATARKIGNVHPNAEFPDLKYHHFLTSARIVGACFESLKATDSLGTWIERTVHDSFHATGTNTNLGIVLLLAPLALAAISDRPVAAVLQSTTIDDARAVYRAIRLVNPGGLSRSESQDVHDEPTVMLREAMAFAKHRDLIARQYADGFADVFEFGVPALRNAIHAFGCIEAAIIDCQLQWLSRFPDSLIARKHGPALAESVQNRAREIVSLGSIALPAGRAAARQLDREMRSASPRWNPGTTADLVAACLFATFRDYNDLARLPFDWTAEDWP